MHTPLTITTPDGVTRATIVPSLGFTCIEFRTQIGNQTVSVLDSEPDILGGQCRPGRSGIPILFPFPNRIRDGRFEYRGRTYHVSPPAWFPQTIHGFCLDRPWRVTEQTPHSLTGEFLLSRDAPERPAQWPADARLTVTYRIRDRQLRADILVENPDRVPLPWGFGTHPYFRLPLGNAGTAAQCRIQALAGKQWTLDQCFPTGELSDVPPEKSFSRGWSYGSCPLDDVYTDLTISEDGEGQRIDDPAAGLSMIQRHSADFRELVVFTPKDRPVICLEPYTCATDAVNLQARGIDAGLRELQPGESASLWFEIEVATI
jgi:aldose 1-epimerase